MARSPRSKNGSKPIAAVRHKDKRKNIPTEELRDFVKEEENKPKTILYPRDPSLDPQLVWKGKDEQDQKPLWVPAVNNAGVWGRWAYVEIRDPWNVQEELRQVIRGEEARR
jgi:hypothetical protein